VEEIMNKKKAIIILCCVIIYSAGTFPVFGQEPETDLRNKRITIRMEQQPLGVVFKYLMEKYDIPIGFEQSTLDRELPDYEFHANLPGQPQARTQSADGSITFTTTADRVFEAKSHSITVDAGDERLEKVFDQIVGQMENYKWEINDGVVNIFPVKGRDERFEKLMGLSIQRFTFAEGKTVKDITTSLLALPEFVRFLKDNKLSFTGYRHGANFILKAQYGRRINVGMDFSDLTFRDLLNKITRIKRGGWVLKWKWFMKAPGWELIDIDI
jgi:hypothetical protein